MVEFEVLEGLVSVIEVASNKLEFSFFLLFFLQSLQDFQFFVISLLVHLLQDRFLVDDKSILKSRGSLVKSQIQVLRLDEF